MEVLFGPAHRPAWGVSDLTSALARASGSIARLDQALTSHPLAPAFLHRVRLDAIRRQAAADGKRIDPWHLAALIEGLRLRMDPTVRIAERGEIFEAGRYAFELHQWLTMPDFDQEGEIKAAEQAFVATPAGQTALLAAAHGIHQWIDAGGQRQPMRAAVVRFWVRRKVLTFPLPLTGTGSLQADVPWQTEDWVTAFLNALAIEAEDWMQLLLDLERAWFGARTAVSGRRRNSRAAMAIDILAASPVVSASSLAKGLDMAVPNAAALLADFCASGIAVEVTHRSKRRLFGLSTLAPLREGVAPPRRPEPGRGRGRPALVREDDVVVPPPPVPPLTPVDRRAFDYSDLAHWMANADQAIRNAKRTLRSIMDQG